MYRYQKELVKGEAIYIAGPLCFYEGGFDMLEAMRRRAETLGFAVTLPNDDSLDLENSDLQKRANSIFANLEKVMLDTTIIVSDLEAFRGSEPDSGTIYEIGMAYAKGAKSYGYTRDKRSFYTKNINSSIKNSKKTDEFLNSEMYGVLPFAPTIIGSTKIVEGDFDDCLKMIIIDKEEEYKRIGRNESYSLTNIEQKKNEKPLVYISDIYRYQENANEVFSKMKKICEKYGLDAITPIDKAEGVEEIDTENPYVWAANKLSNYDANIRRSNVIIANLNNYRGFEVNNDVGFECGMGFQLGKKLYGYIDNSAPLIDRIENFGIDKDFRDHTGSNVENFNYPCNLMFSSSMDIVEGDFENLVKKVAIELLE